MFEFLVVILLIYIGVKLDDLAHWLKTIHEELKSIADDRE